VITVPREHFEDLVAQAIDTLPEPLLDAVDNVVVTVEDRAQGRNLFGLYEGIPLTKRSSGYGQMRITAPDRITIYQETISAVCDTEDELAAQVRKTVLHEFAHHFGISDPRLSELGWA
jgi:predicted Zn-dependent protease with MMP-like domain